jgi:hypothetical protein
VCLAGQIEVYPDGGRSTPYVVTKWLRRAIAPLVAASRWERLYAREESKLVGRRDAEAAFLLAAPLIHLDPGVQGSCRLMVEIGIGESQRLSGATVEVDAGRVVSCIARLEGDPDACVVGSPATWLAAVVDGGADWLEFSGDRGFARNVVKGLHRALFRGLELAEGVPRASIVLICVISTGGSSLLPGWR